MGSQVAFEATRCRV